MSHPNTTRLIQCDTHGETKAVCVDYILFRYVCADCKVEQDKKDNSEK